MSYTPQKLINKSALALLILVTLFTACKKDEQTLTYTYAHPVAVINKGYPGLLTTDLYAIRDTALNYKPDLIILMCGTNDVLRGGYENYQTNLGALVDYLKKDGADMILVTPTTLRAYAVNQRINNLCDIVKTICTEKHCYLADVNLAYTQAQTVGINTLLTSDGIHPTAEGYKLFAAEVFRCYVNNHLSKYKIVCFGDSITFGYYLDEGGTATGNTYPGLLNAMLNKH
jgi:lysophospholipase L1-like esterase